MFGIKIQLDTGKSVSRNDLPRMSILAIQWFELFGMYFEPIVSMPELLKRKDISLQTNAVVAKCALVNLMNFFQINILIGYNISGMLSSSFQATSEANSETK